MSFGYCRDCRFLSSIQAAPGFKLCSRIPPKIDLEDYHFDPAESLAFAFDAYEDKPSEYDDGSGLAVHADFGCAMFEPKLPT